MSQDNKVVILPQKQGCFFGGRSRPSEVFALWPTLIPRDAIKLTTFVEEV